MFNCQLQTSKCLGLPCMDSGVARHILCPVSTLHWSYSCDYCWVRGYLLPYMETWGLKIGPIWLLGQLGWPISCISSIPLPCLVSLKSGRYLFWDRLPGTRSGVCLALILLADCCCHQAHCRGPSSLLMVHICMEIKHTHKCHKSGLRSMASVDPLDIVGLDRTATESMWCTYMKCHQME